MRFLKGERRCLMISETVFLLFFFGCVYVCPCGSITPRCIFIAQVKHCGSNLRVALIKIQLLGHFGGHYFERQLLCVIITLMDN